ncbi:conserved hypothetical protein [Verticillium alfalfae VaMs.102]|uniref:Uncharacterized protein n=1 Tax=Verticillium alfalfae (strain VaMs.102 / ATCC MYA-4576 / FGSC 10136) TaxID=526221 RepID=C9SVP4_VERA1|nr:conserved hypothetical protein [Verticillium alfalfae VaMs.102]EEY22859.1 conserved hypothetical protein [Verticillium alfalfae VaMs.102]
MLHSTRTAARLLPRASTPLTAQLLTPGSRIPKYGGLKSRTVAALYPSRRQYSNSPYDKIDVKAEEEVGKKKIESRPEDVSVDSSTRQVFESSPAAQNNDSVQDGLVHDLGMEYTAKTISSSRTNFRYGMGVLAPVVAWPTLFMPIEAALITQFSAFTGLYLADARATTRGWTPPWYTKYRFILTGIVGVAIFVSLVGRAKVGSAAPRLGQGLSDRVHENLPNKDVDWAALEKKEKEKNRKLKAEAERKQKEEEAGSKDGGRKQSGKGKKSAGDAKDKTKKEDKFAEDPNKNGDKAGGQADSESENQPDTKSDGKESKGKESSGQAKGGPEDEGVSGGKSTDKLAGDEDKKDETENTGDEKASKEGGKEKSKR